MKGKKEEKVRKNNCGSVGEKAETRTQPSAGNLLTSVGGNHQSQTGTKDLKS